MILASDLLDAVQRLDRSVERTLQYLRTIKYAVEGSGIEEAVGAVRALLKPEETK